MRRIRAAIIPKPAPRIPGDPLGVVPVEMAPEPGQVACDGCCFAEADVYPWECANKTAPCLADDRPDGVMVIYITLAEAISRGVVRNSWSDT